MSQAPLVIAAASFAGAVGIMFGAYQQQVQTPHGTPNTDPPAPLVAPPEAAQLFVWFIPSDCNNPCGTHWVYLLWRDGGLWRRLCDADGCGGWEAMP